MNLSSWTLVVYCCHLNDTEHLDDNSTFVQVMVWCHQATSLYLSHIDPVLYHHMASLGHSELNTVNWVIFGLNNGLMPFWHQAITWTNAAVIHLKMSRPKCLFSFKPEMSDKFNLSGAETGIFPERASSIMAVDGQAPYVTKTSAAMILTWHRINKSLSSLKDSSYARHFPFWEIIKKI